VAGRDGANVDPFSPGRDRGCRTRISNSSSANAVRRLVDPLKDFLHTESAGGLFLLAATVVALGWANSPLGAPYTRRPPGR
jgi:hypothetical protein